MDTRKPVNKNLVSAPSPNTVPGATGKNGNTTESTNTNPYKITGPNVNSNINSSLTIRNADTGEYEQVKNPVTDFKATCYCQTKTDGSINSWVVYTSALAGYSRTVTVPKAKTLEEVKHIADKGSEMYNKYLQEAGVEYYKKHSDELTFTPDFSASGVNPQQINTAKVETRGEAHADNAAESGEHQQEQMTKQNKFGEDWRATYGNDDYLKTQGRYADNVARENGWGENLNGMSFDATRNLSRAADRLNNKQWWTTKGQAGMFNAKTGSYDGGLQSNAHRKQPIETQETRQMRMQERLEEQQLRDDLARANKIRNRPYELGVQQAELAYNTMKDILRGNEQLSEELRRNLMQIKMLNPSQVNMQLFLQDQLTKLRINEHAWAYNTAQQIMEQDGIVNAMLFASFFNSQFNVGVDEYYMQYVFNQHMDKNPGDYIGAISETMAVTTAARKRQEEIEKSLQSTTDNGDSSGESKPAPKKKDTVWVPLHDR